MKTSCALNAAPVVGDTERSRRRSGRTAGSAGFLFLVATTLAGAASEDGKPAHQSSATTTPNAAEPAVTSSAPAAEQTTNSVHPADGWRVWFDPETGRIVSQPPEGATVQPPPPPQSVRTPPRIQHFAFRSQDGRTVEGAFLDGAFRSAVQVHVEMRTSAEGEAPTLIRTTCREEHPEPSPTTVGRSTPRVEAREQGEHDSGREPVQ